MEKMDRFDLSAGCSQTIEPSCPHLRHTIDAVNWLGVSKACHPAQVLAA
jgi:hypothetical protein